MNHEQDTVGYKRTDNNMRKYQQLTLFITAIFSLAAFLYYKHEYERLRYTLEYLDTFGSPPDKASGQAKCHFGMYERTYTPPADWVSIAPDLLVYSAFWDDQLEKGLPYVRALAIIRKSSKPPEELKSVFWYETESKVSAANCFFEKVTEREHDLISDSTFHVMYVLCKAETAKSYLFRSASPYMIQFYTSPNSLSKPIFVHEVEQWKSSLEKTAMCVLPFHSPLNTEKLIEYISFHNLIGIEKFVFYGAILTPLTRKLLDKYGDEVGLMYEEKQFNQPHEFAIPDTLARKVIELDCNLRHMDSYENVIILPLNELILPYNKLNIREVIKDIMLSRRHKYKVSEFHISTQQVCIDQEHNELKSPLLMSQQIRLYGSPEEKGVAIMIPRLSIVDNGMKQHVGKNALIVYEYINCPRNAQHSDTSHLPNSNRYVSMIKTSLLYRKFNINN